MFFGFLLSCNRETSDYDYVIEKLDNYYEVHNSFPSSLIEIGVTDENLCYYYENNNYNLEFTTGNDLYWYNSGNGVWDFLENDAKHYRCNK